MKIASLIPHSDNILWSDTYHISVVFFRLSLQSLALTGSDAQNHEPIDVASASSRVHHRRVIQLSSFNKTELLIFYYCVPQY